MAKYRKKPVVIEAIQWTGHASSTIKIQGFMNQELFLNEDGKLMIPTLESPHEASPKDFIIKGVNGEFYPCKPDIFEKTYEFIED